jgi:methionyl-tRNA formyltransferase
MKTVYFGRNINVLKTLQESTELSLVVCDKLTDAEQIDFCARENIPFYFAQNRKELTVITSSRETLDCVCIVSIFGIILSLEIINSFLSVINFHPGDIFTCRGRYPLQCAIVKKLPFMSITAHFITSTEIDAGPVIAQYSVPINFDTSYKNNEDILFSLFPYFIKSVIQLIDSKDISPYNRCYENIYPYNDSPSRRTLHLLYSAETLNKFFDIADTEENVDDLLQD